MRLAVEAAPDVWEMMDEILSENDNQDAMLDARDNLMRAKIVTERLRENIGAVQQGHPAADKKTLREDAHVFVKVTEQPLCPQSGANIFIPLSDCRPTVQHHQDLRRRPCRIPRPAQQDGETHKFYRRVRYPPARIFFLPIIDTTSLFSHGDE